MKLLNVSMFQCILSFADMPMYVAVNLWIEDSNASVNYGYLLDFIIPVFFL